MTIFRQGDLTLRGWTQRPAKGSPVDKTGPVPKTGQQPKATSREAATGPIRLVVELISADPDRLAETRLTLADPPASGLALTGRFEPEAGTSKPGRGQTARVKRLVATLTESVTLEPGETLVPVMVQVTPADAGSKPASANGRLDVILRTLPRSAPAPLAATGVALIGGTLELKLGHLCDQQGCVKHFHKSLGSLAGLGAVRPHPDLKHPRATIYLRAGLPVDLWGMREQLRDQGVEISGIVPHHLPGYRLRIELPRWRADEESVEVLQCMLTRDAAIRGLEKLAWTKRVGFAGGGINLQPGKDGVDLVEMLDAIAGGGTAPLSAWLLPDGVPMPKSAPAQLTRPRVGPRQGGSRAHPVVEFEFERSSDVGTGLLSLLAEQKWASLTRVDSHETTIARLAIGDRKYANLIPLLHGMRQTGRVPRQIRLREFGDIRIQITFAHICGDVEYSKPPKRKKKPKDQATKDTKDVKKGDAKKGDAKKGDAKKGDAKKGDAKKGDAKKAKPKKPFVPRPLRPAKTSNGRRAIEAAIRRVSWIKRAVFHDYHTKPHFNQPRKLMLAFRARGDDVLRLDELVAALRQAGFPPQSLVVSRRFSGLPFGKPMPGELRLTDREGKQRSLESFRRPDRPLAVAFVSLNCKRNKKYKADPKYFDTMRKTIERYRDRVDFVVVSAGGDDKFADVVEFWKKTAVAGVPIWHDADAKVRAVLNAQDTAAPHIFVFDPQGLLRYAGDVHSQWDPTTKGFKKGKPREDYLGQALELVLAGKYRANGAVFYNKSVCNCSHPKCKCPKCGCGASCRCGIGHCKVGY